MSEAKPRTSCTGPATPRQRRCLEACARAGIDMFRQPELRRTFCPTREEYFEPDGAGNLRPRPDVFTGFDQILDAGKVVGLEMPKQIFFDAAIFCQVALKAQWQDAVLRRETIGPDGKLLMPASLRRGHRLLLLDASGAAFGGIAARAYGWYGTPLHPAGVVVSIAGAILVLFINRAILAPTTAGARGIGIHPGKVLRSPRCPHEGRAIAPATCEEGTMMNVRWVSACLLGAGCGLSPGEGGGEAAAPAVEQASQALTTRLIYESSDERMVPPWTAAHADRAVFYGRTVGVSNAFLQCVKNSMTESYLSMGELDYSLSHARRVETAARNFQTGYNTISIGFRPWTDFPGAGMSAWVGDPSDHGTKGMTAYSGYLRADSEDWTGFDPAVPEYPWIVGADWYIHEFMHSAGYTHADPSCSLACPTGSPGMGTPAECSWTTYCGGSGVPPAGMEWGTAGASFREFVAYKNGFGDRGYYTRGEPSAPYLYGGCASQVLSRSQGTCATTRPTCAIDQVAVVTGWTGEWDTPQTIATCECVRDPRHMIALKNDSGWSWSAANGGGGDIRTRWSGGWGAWEIFYGVDNHSNLLDWFPGDMLALKSFDGHFVTAGFLATATAPEYVRFDNADGSAGRIANGSRVRAYRRSSFFPYRDHFAVDDGAKLVSSTTASTTFRVVEPRQHLVYLGSHHERFVNLDPDGSIHNRRTPAELDYGTMRDPEPLGEALDPGRVAKQASAAFWLIDWNGGQLMDGDRISLQAFQNDSHHYVSTWGSTGATRWRNGAGTHETFVIRRKGTAGGRLAHEEQVTLRSATGNYLIALPPDYHDGEVWNTATVAREWETFSLRFVHSYDLDRRRFFP